MLCGPFWGISKHIISQDKMINSVCMYYILASDFEFFQFSQLKTWTVAVMVSNLNWQQKPVFCRHFMVRFGSSMLLFFVNVYL